MRRGGQGEALAVWAVWLLTLLAVVVTYSRIDAAELYNVAGQRSRPRAQPRRGAHQLAVRARRDRARARGDAGPAAARLVDRGAGDRALRDDAAVRQPVAPQRALGEPRSRRRRRARARTGRRRDRGGPAPRSSRGSPAIRVRIVLAVVVLVLSLPWIAAELGFHLPGDVFMGQELFRTARRASRGGGAPRRAPRVARLADAALGARPLAGAGRSAGSGSGSWSGRRRSRPTAPSTPPRTSGRSSSSSAARWTGRSRALSIPVSSR